MMKKTYWIVSSARARFEPGFGPGPVRAWVRPGSSPVERAGNFEGSARFERAHDFEGSSATLSWTTNIWNCLPGIVCAIRVR